MERVIVPRANAQEKPLLEAQGIHFIESISSDALKQCIVEFLDQRNVLHLATCRDNEPRCTALEYWNNGLTVYIGSEGGGKFGNLRKNPRVCFSICDPYDPLEDFFSARGLQVWGTASVYNQSDHPAEFAEARRYSRNARHREALVRQGIDRLAALYTFGIIAIEPTMVRLLDLRRGFRNVIWKKTD